MSRKTAIGPKKLTQAPYRVVAHIEGATDELPESRGSAKVYKLIYKEFGANKMDMSTYGFETKEEAENCKKRIEDIAQSEGFKASVTILHVPETS